MAEKWIENLNKEYLLQTKSEDGMVYAKMAMPAEIIKAHGFQDCSGDDYAVYDVSEFGKAVLLIHNTYSRPNFHCFVNSENGEVEFEGHSPEH